MNRNSIRYALLIRLSVSAVVLCLLLIIGMYFVIRHETNELYDGELSQLARLLTTLYGEDGINLKPGATNTLVTAARFEGKENYEKQLAFQIWDDQGHLLVRSANAPIEPITHLANQFSTENLFGNSARVYALKIPQNRFTVQVAQRMEIRAEIMSEMLESFLVIIGIAFTIVLYLMWRAINEGLGPLNKIASAITERSSDNLETIQSNDIPEEILGVTQALNNLFTRLKTSLHKERHFIADAAHELRTPLAGLKAQAQIGLQDKTRVEKSLRRIVQGVDRTSHLANQLLALSRFESDQIALKRNSLVLQDILDRVIQDLSDEVDKKSIKFDILQTSDVEIYADSNMIYMLIRNLIDNAIRYSPASSTITTSVTGKDSNVLLTIIDQGPGIAEDNLPRVFDRFFRVLDSNQQGSGLGLSIVKRIADLHGATVTLKNAATGGLTIIVLFAK